jgi:hypothetical protein
VGDDCRGGELPCKRDLVCGDTSRCQLPPGLGEPSADGEPCVLDAECSSGFCDRYADERPRCAMPLVCP